MASSSVPDLHVPLSDFRLADKDAHKLPETKRAQLPRNVRSVANIADASGHLPHHLVKSPTLRHHVSDPVDGDPELGGLGGGAPGGHGPKAPPRGARAALGRSSSLAPSANSGHSGHSAAGLRQRPYNVRSDPSLDEIPFDVWDDPAASAPFAGRIGGNLAFTSKTARHPDSHKITTLKGLLDPPGFRDPLYIRAAAIEGIGTFLLSFMISLNQLAAAQFGGSSRLAQTSVEAVMTGTTTSMMIYATAAPTGGHLNPFVTMATVCAGLCTVPRGVYYMIAQTVGAIAGNYALKLGVGADNFFASGEIGGCTVDFARISIGQTYVLETCLYAVIAFMSFGVGLDPRQTPIFGPAYSQFLVGLSLTLTVWGSPYIRDGYGGISINPARCLGAQTARYVASSAWIHWLAAFSASVINGFVYHIMPPAAPSLVRKHN